MMENIDYFRAEPVTKEQFLLDNPFGKIFTDQDGPELRALTQEEYDEFVENSRGIWDEE
jgi:hypothetical protein